MKSAEFSRTALIVGIDGKIGGALAAHLENLRWTVYGTSRRKTKRQGVFYLDLADVKACSELPSVGVAFVCAAETKKARCREAHHETQRINVDGPILLASRLVANGTYVIFLSSNAVFDGSVGYCRAEDAVCPGTIYGEQKVRTEQRLLELGECLSIVRLTKVLAHGDPLITGWIQSLSRSEVIRPISDMVVAPVFLDIVTHALEKIAAARCGGIFHLSGSRDVSYAEIARYIVHRMGVSDSLVCPMRSDEVGVPRCEVFLHSTLDCGRLKKLFGISPPDPFEVIDTVFKLN